jgi:hypothetical protein
VLGQVLAWQADGVIPWTGRQMAVAKFLPHRVPHLGPGDHPARVGRKASLICQVAEFHR